MPDLVIHFAVYDQNEGRILSSLPTSLGATPTEGTYRLKVVCDPSIPLPAASDGYGLSVDPRVVSCPACKQTDEYKREASLYFPPRPSETVSTTTEPPNNSEV